MTFGKGDEDRTRCQVIVTAQEHLPAINALMNSSTDTPMLSKTLSVNAEPHQQLELRWEKNAVY